ncbi:WecB/TagA/CpsF family glycosyltransferase [Paenalcaligenes suwonensis]|uniref:WecB/TagA/CpsF family glycosyltransferase n=1 Tax=Paenalcaligenes suwonensis TaxID=1202713 RepID=UPI0014090A09|nr:WecB/TagA/CpsF family glycosyltransferase [Paenalcaligenes suwonensis]NHC60268.1 WecB/TagA/CpsF family glycosyltransferase [Paenalcaligenes suwonensis]
MISFDRISVLNTYFDLLSEDEVLSIISGLNDLNEMGFRYIVTPNVDHVVRNCRSSEYQNLYKDSWLSLCDSRVLYRLLTKKSYPIRSVVTGSDLTLKIFEEIIDGSVNTISIIGVSEETVDKVKEKFKLQFVNHYNPKMGFINDDIEVKKCLDFLLNNPSDFVFFAVGSPQQEILANKFSKLEGSKGLGFCIGASLLFLSGEEKRAPKIVSTIGFEWLFRLFQNPRRLWKRYYDNLKIFSLVRGIESFSGERDKRSID